MKNLKINKRIASLFLTGTLVLTSLTGCSLRGNTSKPNLEDINASSVLASATEYEDIEVQDYINEMPFTDASFRDAYYNFLSNHTFRQDQLVYDYWDLEILDISEVSDLSDLRLFPNLKTLIIRDSSDLDLSQLEDLKLNNLEFYNCKVDFSKVPKKSTQYCMIYDCEVENIESLKNVSSLSSLEIAFTKLGDLSFLKDLKSLDCLSLINTGIADYSVLKDLKIDNLTIGCTQADDWSFLSDMKGLKSLSVSMSKFTDVSILSSLSKLERLDLSHTFVKDLSLLANNKKLTELDIRGCLELESLSPLQDMDNIENILADNLEMKYDSSQNISLLLKSEDFSEAPDIKNSIIEFYDSIGIKDDMSDEEKIRLITIAVLRQIEYDLEGEQPTAYYNENELKTALNGKGICASYAGFTSALLDLAGIDNYSLSGECINGYPDFLHMWNIVYVDGKWYGLDTTFLDDIDAIDELESGEDTLYYLDSLSSDEWKENHYPFIMPSIGNEYDYNLALQR